MRQSGLFFLLIGILSLGIILSPQMSYSHCDTMDGPVVKAAQKALETSNINPVLIWVKEDDEAAIKAAFEKTLAVRKLNAAAKDLADVHFFETLVRIHRAGEGEPYTGLKPAGLDIGPAIPAAEKALAEGSLETLHNLISKQIETGLHEQFHRALHTKDFKPDDVEAGRHHIEAYVTYLHYVERLYEAAIPPAEGHGHNAEKRGSTHEGH